MRDSDGTVLFSIGAALAGGSKETADFALRHCKPWLHLSREREGESATKQLSDFLEKDCVQVLNIAGPRESEEPEAGQFVREILEKAIPAAGSNG